MDNNTLIDKKTTRLSQNQTFTLFLMAMLFFVGYSSYNGYVEGKVTKNHQIISIKKSDQIISLLKIMVEGRVDVLSEDAALEKYHDKFNCSAYAILDMAMHTLTINNVHDSIRQIQIRTYYDVAITNMYMDDTRILSKFRCGDKRLDGVMAYIHPNEILDPVLKIMFSDRKTLQKRKDIRQFLYGSFERYYQKGTTYIKE